MELKKQGDHDGAVFTPDSYEEVRQWVQDRAEQSEIVATPTRLYLPIGLSNMVTADENDTIWHDPEGGPNAFYLERG